MARLRWSPERQPTGADSGGQIQELCFPSSHSIASLGDERCPLFAAAGALELTDASRTFGGADPEARFYVRSTKLPDCRAPRRSVPDGQTRSS